MNVQESEVSARFRAQSGVSSPPGPAERSGASSGKASTGGAGGGGSGGRLPEIIKLALERNPAVRVVLNTVTVETFAEAIEALKTMPVKGLDIAQLSVARSRKSGGYHLMTALNPVFVISCTGGSDNE